MGIRLLIADDHIAFEEAISFWLSQQTNIDVVGLAPNGRVAINLTGEFQPDVVLMDSTMPHLNGIEAAREIVEMTPASRILILSDHLDSPSVREALEAGASGYPFKDCSLKELAHAVRRVA